MSIRKRILVLAAAGLSAVVLGGLVSSQHRTAVEAAGPTHAAIGCANSTLATDIAFQTATNGIIASSNQIASPSAVLSAGAVAPGVLSVAIPNGVVLCGAVFEDDAGAPPTAPHDADPSTVDGGSINYTLTSGVATILESNTSNFARECGSTAIFEGCQGGVLAGGVACVAALSCTTISPNPSNTVHVALRTGATFSLVGAASPVVLLSAVYSRFPSVTALAGAVPAGPVTVTTNTTTIGITVPAYAASLSPNPAIIPAASGSGVSSTLTLSLFHLVATTCSTVAPGVAGGSVIICLGGGATFFTTVPGAESGVATFSTSSGVLGGTTAAQGGGQQVFSEHCGALPATVPTILIPALGLGTGLSLTACVSAQAQLFGGGAAGTAVVVGSFVGDFTGSTAQATTTVELSPTAATVPLSRGCNQVVTPANTAANTPIATIVGEVQPSGIVVSVWQFNNSLHAFQAGFFSTAGAPTDFGSVGPNAALFICVSSNGTFPTGAF